MDDDKYPNELYRQDSTVLSTAEGLVPAGQGLETYTQCQLKPRPSSGGWRKVASLDIRQKGCSWFARVCAEGRLTRVPTFSGAHSAHSSLSWASGAEDSGQEILKVGQ